MEAILALPAAERSPNPKASPSSYTRQAAADAMAAFVDPGDQAAGRKTKPDVSLAADHAAAAAADDMLLPVPVAPKTAPNKQPACSVPPPNKPSLVCRDKLRAVAHKLADQPVHGAEPGTWGVLTAISKNARLLPQGTGIPLYADEHCFGRTVDDYRFRISDISVSSCHCKIYMDNVLKELNPNEPSPFFLKDTSTNGTYINWKRFRKSSAPTKLTHGDIISFAYIPHDETSYAFVYHEVTEISSEEGGTAIKKKLGEVGSENKGLEDTTVCSADGPVKLDVRRPQKTSMDLKEQLASHVAMIEELRTEIKLAQAWHEKEAGELKDTIASSQLALGEKQKRFDLVSELNMELKSMIKYLGEKLDASDKSQAEAGKTINRLKVNICKLEEQLQDERNMRMEYDKSSEDLKCSCFRLP